MAAAKKKNPETVKVSFTGSSTVTEDLSLDDRVIFIVEGTISNEGVASTASQGEQAYRKIRMESALLAPDDVREQLAVMVQEAKDEAAGVQSIDFPDHDGDDDFDGDAE